MDYKDAENLLPKFNHLIGYTSKRYEQKITDVFVGFISPILTGQMYWWAKRVKSFASLPTDAGTYTVCVALKTEACFQLKILF